MKALIVVTVTSEDIRAGIPEHGCRCPIGLAAARALGMEAGIDVIVLPGWLSVADPGHTGRRQLYDLPDKAQLFMTAFDAGIPGPPFTFTATIAGRH